MPNPEPNPFDARYAKIRRRLREAAEADADRFRAIEVGNAASYRSGSTIKAIAAEISRQMQHAVDWTLAEADLLPGDRRIARKVALPHVTAALGEHLNRLRVTSRWGQILEMAAQVGNATKAAADALYSKIEANLQSDLEEFAGGVWEPREQIAAGMTFSRVTNNLATFNAPVTGNVQQSGEGSSQQASFSISPDNVRRALADLKTAIETAGVTGSELTDLVPDITTIEVQLGKARPNLAIMQGAATDLRDLTVAVLGGLLTPQVQALLNTLGLS